MSTGSVYRLIGSKENLLVLVMHSFTSKITAGWEAVLESDSTVIEKLDALIWVDINTLDRFTEEFQIQLGWFLESPGATARIGWLVRHDSRRWVHCCAPASSPVRSGCRPARLPMQRCASSSSSGHQENVVDAGPLEALAFAHDAVLRGGGGGGGGGGAAQRSVLTEPDARESPHAAALGVYAGVHWLPAVPDPLEVGAGLARASRSSPVGRRPSPPGTGTGTPPTWLALTIGSRRSRGRTCCTPPSGWRTSPRTWPTPGDRGTPAPSAASSASRPASGRCRPGRATRRPGS